MSGPNPYDTTFAAVVAIVRHEGFLAGMWRGTLVSSARAAVYSGTQLATYESTKKALLRHRIFEQEGPRMHVGASLFAAVCSLFASQPVDTVKTVLMERRSSHVGAMRVLSKLMAEGGIQRLYKGFLPAIACKVPVVTVFLPLVEQIRFRLFDLEYL